MSKWRQLSLRYLQLHRSWLSNVASERLFQANAGNQPVCSVRCVALDYAPCAFGGRPQLRGGWPASQTEIADRDGNLEEGGAGAAPPRWSVSHESQHTVMPTTRFCGRHRSSARGLPGISICQPGEGRKSERQSSNDKHSRLISARAPFGPFRHWRFPTGLGQASLPLELDCDRQQMIVPDHRARSRQRS